MPQQTLQFLSLQTNLRSLLNKVKFLFKTKLLTDFSRSCKKKMNQSLHWSLTLSSVRDLHYSWKIFIITAKEF